MSGKFIGACAACKTKLRVDHMAKHVATCDKRPTGTADGLQIVARSPELPDYWMQIEAQPHATLEDLDQFLRKAWLECCGHMSAFTIKKQTYSSTGGDFDLADQDAHDMDVRLSELLRPRSKFSHEYDAGTTTTLIFQVEGRLKVKPSKKPIRLLALNDPPKLKCEECGKPATGLCAYCDAMPLCKPCIKDHECGDEGIADIVNSPRAGVCGYEGPPIKI